MFPSSRTLLLIVSAFTLGACASNPPVHESIPRFAGQPPAQPPRLGKVTLVNDRIGFVLIDGGKAPAPGTGLVTRPADGVTPAALKVSVEKSSPFIIADIVSGVPHVGDLVVVADE